MSTSVLEPDPEIMDKKIPVLPITFFSASSFPLAAPQTVSQGFGWPSWGLGVEGVNSRVGKWALHHLRESAKGKENEPRMRGWTLMDYYEEPQNALVPLLIEFNFRGRKAGEEGW